VADVVPSPSSESASGQQTERIACLLVGGLLVALGIRRNSVVRLATMVVGGALILRSARGHLGIAEKLGAIPEESELHPWQRGIFVRESIVISRPREEVYAFWRNFENLPRFMRHLEAVEVESERLSHWKARGPAGKNVTWDAEVTTERGNELIGWRSLAGASVENTGEVTFEDAPGNRGTIIRVTLTYRPPAGVIGAAVARIFGEEPHGQIRDDLRRLRSLLEAGEVPSTEGQPSDRVRKAKGWVGMRLLGPGLSGSDDEPVPSEEANQR
jgi:uncharacterized membrane protein